MSNYRGYGEHPETGEIEPCDWLDDYFGKHRYGTRFADGIIRAGVVEIPANAIRVICRKCGVVASEECDNAGHQFRYEDSRGLDAALGTML